MAKSVFLGRGDVYTTGTVTDGAVAVFDGTTGRFIKSGASSGGYVTSITGTANQIVASAATGAVTLSLSPTLTGIDSITFSGGASIVGSQTNALVLPLAGQFVWGSASASGVSQWAWSIAGAYPSTHALVGGFMRLTPTVTMPNASGGAFMDPRGISFQPTYDFGGKTGTVDQLNGFELDTPVVSNRASATIRNTALFHTFGDISTTATGLNYSVWVGTGITANATTRLDDKVILGPTGNTDVSDANAVEITHTGTVTNFKTGLGGVFAGIHAATAVFDTNVTVGGAILTNSASTTANFNGAIVSAAGTSSLGGAQYIFTPNIRFSLKQGTEIGFAAGAGSDDFAIIRAGAGIMGINDAGSNGVTVNVATDTIAWFKSRAGADTATVKANKLQITGLPAFVAADKYVVVDSSGNFHVSALGPAS